MEINLTHVIEENASPDAVHLLSILLDRLSPHEVAQSVVVVGRMPAGLRIPDGVRVDRTGRRLWWMPTGAFALMRLIQAQCAEAVMAWSGPTAARIGGLQRIPTAAVITGTREAWWTARWWKQSVARRRFVGLVACSGTVGRLLVRAGVPAEVISLVRPGVDPAVIRSAATRVSRTDLGLEEDAVVLVMPGPPSREGGQFFGVWAAAILYQVEPRVRILIPGVSREQRRIARLAERIYCPEVPVLVGDRFAPGELLSVSDFHVVPSTGGVRDYWTACALAIGVPVIATGVPSVREILADGRDAFLCEPGQPHALARRLWAAMGDSEACRRHVEAGRDTARRLFDADRCVRAFGAVADCLANARWPTTVAKGDPVAV